MSKLPYTFLAGAPTMRKTHCGVTTFQISIPYPASPLAHPGLYLLVCPPTHCSEVEGCMLGLSSRSGNVSQDGASVTELGLSKSFFKHPIRRAMPTSPTQEPDSNGFCFRNGIFSVSGKRSEYKNYSEVHGGKSVIMAYFMVRMNWRK